ncbi:acid protease [Pholiota molesta]|nr:acid protease [Pholiota molesta]
MPSWKGKERQIEARDDGVEGNGGADGVVLALDMVGTGIYDVAYTIPVKFGVTQQFSLQIDTGSSDLWVASTSCSTSSCSLTKGRLYNPAGSASGPIVWDNVTLGGYSIDNQALAAVNDVQSEPLAPNFSGILGLALPLNSIIAKTYPPLERRAFSSGIGHHPSALVPDPSKIQYSTLVSERSGTLFWKASVRAITVYVNSVPKPISLGRAVLDSGVPLIFTTTAVANAIYGALGVTPGSDGTYYVPCHTPLNLTVTLDDRPEIPIHPLDLTAEPPDSNQAQFCIGLIQPADAVLTSPTSAIGDMILGVPFLRNTYTVMAYTPPSSDGTFPPLSTTTTTSSSNSNSNSVASDDDQPPSRVATQITPQLGLLPLTDPTRALAEFNTVRVLNQPLSSGAAAPPNTGSNSNTKTVDVGGKKLSVGIVILIGLLSFFALCCALFGGRWLLFRRRYGRARKAGFGNGDSAEGLDQKTVYMLARRTSRGALGAVPLVGGGGAGDEETLTLTEDELRERRYRSYMRKSGKLSESTVGSERTLAADPYAAPGEDGEFGYDAGAWGDATLVAPRRTADPEARPLVVGASPPSSPPSSPDQPAFPHARTYSDPPEPPAPDAGGHARTPSAQPLLGPRQSSGDLDELVVASHARLFSVDSTEASAVGGDLLQPVPPASLRLVAQPPARTDSSVLDLAQFGSGAPPSPTLRTGAGEEGGDVHTGMAGIGSASRGSRFLGMGPRPSIDSLPFNRESLMSVSSVGSTVAGLGVALGSPSDVGADKRVGASSP